MKIQLIVIIRLMNYDSFSKTLVFYNKSIFKKPHFVKNRNEKNMWSVETIKCPI